MPPRNSPSRYRTVSKFILLLMIVILLVLALLNLRLSHRFASAEELTITGVCRKWFSGISATELYSGGLLLAIHRLQMAFTQILIAVLFGAVLWERKTRN